MPNLPLLGGVAPPDLRQASRRRGFIRLQQAYTTLGISSCKQKRPRRTAFNFLIFLRNSGAGEGIRTLDPNLGKFQTPSIRQHLFLSRSPLSPYSTKPFLAVAHPRGILFLPFETRFRASPLLPRPPPGFPGKQNPEFVI